MTPETPTAAVTEIQTEVEMEMTTGAEMEIRMAAAMEMARGLRQEGREVGMVAAVMEVGREGEMVAMMVVERAGAEMGAAKSAVPVTVVYAKATGQTATAAVVAAGAETAALWRR